MTALIIDWIIDLQCPQITSVGSFSFGDLLVKIWKIQQKRYSFLSEHSFRLAYMNYFLSLCPFS